MLLKQMEKELKEMEMVEEEEFRYTWKVIWKILRILCIWRLSGIEEQEN